MPSELTLVRQVALPAQSETSTRRLGWARVDLDHFIHPGLELGYGEHLFHVG